MLKNVCTCACYHALRCLWGHDFSIVPEGTWHISSVVGEEEEAAAAEAAPPIFIVFRWIWSANTRYSFLTRIIASYNTNSNKLKNGCVCFRREEQQRADVWLMEGNGRRRRKEGRLLFLLRKRWRVFEKRRNEWERERAEREPRERKFLLRVSLATSFIHSFIHYSYFSSI